MIAFGAYHITQISKDDASGIHQLMVHNAERFHRFFPKTLEANRTLSVSQEFAAKKQNEFENKEEFLFVLKENSAIIGLVYVKELDWKKKQGELAYCITVGHERKGIVTKAVDLLSSYAFTHLDLETLQIIVHKDNKPSVKVAEKCGFQWQSTLLELFTPPNEAALDMELYELYKPTS